MTSSSPPAEPSPLGDSSSFHFARVVLLGFMASGKTEVGRALAERLGWRHIDLDDEIERLTGKSVAEIFATDGEAAFRELEVTLTPPIAAQREVVVSPGGGWVTNPGLFDGLQADTLTVWLKVSPATVLERVAADEDQPVRPLLAGVNARQRIESLLAEREPSYQRARVEIDTEGLAIREIVDRLMDILSPGHNPGQET